MKLITESPPTTTAKRTFQSRMQCNKCRLKEVKIVANTQKAAVTKTENNKSRVH